MNKSLKLGQVVDYSKERIAADKVPLENFITVDNLLPNKGGITLAENMPQGGALPRYERRNILVGNIRPYLKKIWFADREGGAANDVLIFNVKSEYCPKFIYYAMFRDDFFDHMMRGKKGTKMPRGDKKQILDFLVPDLKYSSQEKIAAVLSSLDAKISLNKRINVELEAMAKTLYDYWFVQFDFPNEKGKAYKSSGGKMVFEKVLKREIPFSWIGANILSVAELLGGGTPTKKESSYWGGKIPFFTPTDADEAIYKFATENYITEAGLNNSSTKLYDPNTIFITARGSVGRLVLAGVPMAMNQSCYALKAKSNVSYAYLYFLAKELIHHLEVKASGSVFDSIVSSDIEFTNLAIPEVGVIRKYAKIAEPIFELIAKNTREIGTLSELRDWLLPMLMNGQVSISENASEDLKDKEKLSSRNAPSIKKETSASDVVYFRPIVPRREDRYVNCVPSLDFEIAAGAFGEDQRPNFNEWVEINTSRQLKKGMFVAKVVGHSMEPLIPDGAHCLFQRKAPQLRNDMVAVFQLHDSEDPESGGHYTVKRLRVYRQNTDEGVVRKAKLMPENPAFQPITVDEDNVKFVAEFLEVLQPLTK